MTDFDGEGDDNGQDEVFPGIPQDAMNELLSAYESFGFDTDDTLSAYGITLIEDPGTLRGLVFDSAQGAIEYLNQFGGVTWSDVVYLDDGVWGIRVPDNSP